jgi:8-oxo-dGTP pyrophosphatase MutT (NUDIX family)
VALALAGAEDALHLAMILRAEREGDPWSGQMALPGGRADPADADAAAVAERETEEEIGLVLRRAQLVAPLAVMPVVRRGVDTGMVLAPHVYYAGERHVRLTPSPEVADAWWVPLAHLLDPAQATEYRYTLDGARLRFDAIAFERQVIWGLTHRVLTAFFARLGLELPTRARRGSPDGDPGR